MTGDPSALAPKSILRLRARPHLHPNRGGEAIVEVVREGEVEATIYARQKGMTIRDADQYLREWHVRRKGGRVDA